MSLLSIFLTERPMTSGLDFLMADVIARVGSRSNIRSSTLTSCPARSAASATTHAPIGMTGMGKTF